MAQLWGGRFTKETDQLVYNFNASISFDQKFYKQDIRGSILAKKRFTILYQLVWVRTLLNDRSVIWMVL